MWSHPVTSETSPWLLSDSVCVTRMKLAVLSVASFSANSRFASQVFHPLVHRRVPTILREPLDVVCHGLSCIPAQRSLAISRSGATNHKSTTLVFFYSSRHHSPNRVLCLSPWVAPPSCCSSCTSFGADSSAVSMSEQVHLPMIARKKKIVVQRLRLT